MTKVFYGKGSLSFGMCFADVEWVAKIIGGRRGVNHMVKQIPPTHKTFLAIMNQLHLWNEGGVDSC